MTVVYLFVFIEPKSFLRNIFNIYFVFGFGFARLLPFPISCCSTVLISAGALYSFRNFDIAERCCGVIAPGAGAGAGVGAGVGVGVCPGACPGCCAEVLNLAENCLSPASSDCTYFTIRSLFTISLGFADGAAGVVLLANAGDLGAAAAC